MTSLLTSETRLTPAFLCPTISKLPLVPDVAYEGRINFQWPTEPLLKSIKDGSRICLSKIELFKNADKASAYLTGIRMTLSNGQRSELFKGSHSAINVETISVNQETPIRMIKTKSYGYGVYGFIMEDSEGKQLCKWQPKVFNKEDKGVVKEQELNEGE